MDVLDIVTVQVKYTCACDRCGTVNLTKEQTMSKDAFDEARKVDSAAFWQEDSPKGVVYRHHEEGKAGRCLRGC